MSRPPSISVKRSGYIWCLQIQEFLQTLISANIKTVHVFITLPREVHYAVSSNRGFLLKHFPFLEYPNIIFKSSSQSVENANIKFELDTHALDANDPNVQKVFYNQDLPDEVRYHYDIPDWFRDAAEGRSYYDKGAVDEYLKILDQRYLAWCQQTGQEPKFK